MKEPKFSDLPLRFHYEVDQAKGTTELTVIRRDSGETIYRTVLPKVYKKYELELLSKDLVDELELAFNKRRK